MSNADSPDSGFVEYKIGGFPMGIPAGLTKREYFCLQMGVPETGDPELDSIIRKGNEQKIAAMAMQGFISAGGNGLPASDRLALLATSYAISLINEVERGNE